MNNGFYAWNYPLPKNGGPADVYANDAGDLMLTAIGSGHTKGSATKIPVITIDEKGRVVSLTEEDAAGGATGAARAYVRSGTLADPLIGDVTGGTLTNPLVPGLYSVIFSIPNDSGGSVTFAREADGTVTVAQVIGGVL